MLTRDQLHAYLAAGIQETTAAEELDALVAGLAGGQVPGDLYPDAGRRIAAIAATQPGCGLVFHADPEGARRRQNEHAARGVVAEVLDWQPDVHAVNAAVGRVRQAQVKILYVPVHFLADESILQQLDYLAQAPGISASVYDGGLFGDRGAYEGYAPHFEAALARLPATFVCRVQCADPSTSQARASTSPGAVAVPIPPMAADEPTAGGGISAHDLLHAGGADEGGGLDADTLSRILERGDEADDPDEEIDAATLSRILERSNDEASFVAAAGALDGELDADSLSRILERGDDEGDGGGGEGPDPESLSRILERGAVDDEGGEGPDPESLSRILERGAVGGDGGEEPDPESLSHILERGEGGLDLGDGESLDADSLSRILERGEDDMGGATMAAGGTAPAPAPEAAPSGGYADYGMSTGDAETLSRILERGEDEWDDFDGAGQVIQLGGAPAPGNVTSVLLATDDQDHQGPEQDPLAYQESEVTAALLSTDLEAALQRSEVGMDEATLSGILGQVDAEQGSQALRPITAPGEAVVLSGAQSSEEIAARLKTDAGQAEIPDAALLSSFLGRAPGTQPAVSPRRSDPDDLGALVDRPWDPSAEEVGERLKTSAGQAVLPDAALLSSFIGPADQHPGGPPMPEDSLAARLKTDAGQAIVPDAATLSSIFEGGATLPGETLSDVLGGPSSGVDQTLSRALMGPDSQYPGMDSSRPPASWEDAGSDAALAVSALFADEGESLDTVSGVFGDSSSGVGDAAFQTLSGILGGGEGGGAAGDSGISQAPPLVDDLVEAPEMELGDIGEMGRDELLGELRGMAGEPADLTGLAAGPFDPSTRPAAPAGAVSRMILPDEEDELRRPQPGEISRQILPEEQAFDFEGADFSGLLAATGGVRRDPEAGEVTSFLLPDDADQPRRDPPKPLTAPGEVHAGQGLSVMPGTSPGEATLPEDPDMNSLSQVFSEAEDELDDFRGVFGDVPEVDVPEQVRADPESLSQIFGGDLETGIEDVFREVDGEAYSDPYADPFSDPSAGPVSDPGMDSQPSHPGLFGDGDDASARAAALGMPIPDPASAEEAGLGSLAAGGFDPASRAPLTAGEVSRMILPQEEDELGASELEPPGLDPVSLSQIFDDTGFEASGYPEAAFQDPGSGVPSTLSGLFDSGETMRLDEDSLIETHPSTGEALEPQILVDDEWGATEAFPSLAPEPGGAGSPETFSGIFGDADPGAGEAMPETFSGVFGDAPPSGVGGSEVGGDDSDLGDVLGALAQAPSTGPRREPEPGEVSRNLLPGVELEVPSRDEEPLADSLQVSGLFDAAVFDDLLDVAAETESVSGVFGNLEADESASVSEIFGEAPASTVETSSGIFGDPASGLEDEPSLDLDAALAGLGAGGFDPASRPEPEAGQVSRMILAEEFEELHGEAPPASEPTGLTALRAAAEASGAAGSAPQTLSRIFDEDDEDDLGLEASGLLGLRRQAEAADPKPGAPRTVSGIFGDEDLEESPASVPPDDVLSDSLEDVFATLMPGDALTLEAEPSITVDDEPPAAASEEPFSLDGLMGLDLAPAPEVELDELLEPPPEVLDGDVDAPGALSLDDLLSEPMAAPPGAPAPAGEADLVDALLSGGGLDEVFEVSPELFEEPAAAFDPTALEDGLAGLAARPGGTAARDPRSVTALLSPQQAATASDLGGLEAGLAEMVQGDPFGDLGFELDGLEAVEEPPAGGELTGLDALIGLGGDDLQHLDLGDEGGAFDVGTPAPVMDTRPGEARVPAQFETRPGEARIPPTLETRPGEAVVPEWTGEDALDFVSEFGRRAGLDTSAGKATVPELAPASLDGQGDGLAGMLGSLGPGEMPSFESGPPAFSLEPLEEAGQALDDLELPPLPPLEEVAAAPAAAPHPPAASPDPMVAPAPPAAAPGEELLPFGDAPDLGSLEDLLQAPISLAGESPAGPASPPELGDALDQAIAQAGRTPPAALSYDVGEIRESGGGLDAVDSLLAGLGPAEPAAVPGVAAAPEAVDEFEALLQSTAPGARSAPGPAPRHAPRPSAPPVADSAPAASSAPPPRRSVRELFDLPPELEAIYDGADGDLRMVSLKVREIWERDDEDAFAALRLILDVARSFPGDKVARYAEGSVHLLRNRRYDGLAALRRAAELARAEGDMLGLGFLLEELRERMPDDPGVGEALAEYFREANRNEDARKVLEALGDQALEAGMGREAVHHLERAHALQPGAKSVPAKLLRALHSVGAEARALEFCNDYLATRPNSPVVLAHQGVAFERLARPADAERAFERAFDKAWTDLARLEDLYLEFQAAGQQDLKRRAADRILEMDPDNRTVMRGSREETRARALERGELLESAEKIRLAAELDIDLGPPVAFENLPGRARPWTGPGEDPFAAALAAESRFARQLRELRSLAADLRAGQEGGLPVGDGPLAELMRRFLTVGELLGRDSPGHARALLEHSRTFLRGFEDPTLLFLWKEQIESLLRGLGGEARAA